MKERYVIGAPTEYGVRWYSGTGKVLCVLSGAHQYSQLHEAQRARNHLAVMLGRAPRILRVCTLREAQLVVTGIVRAQ